MPTIFQFPDLDTFRLAVSSGQVPPAVSLAPAEVGFDPEGALSVEPSGNPPKNMLAALKRLGVKTGKAHYGSPESVGSWLQVLPVFREGAPPQLSTQAPVLFELPDPKQLPVLVGEMLRLGNDRQYFRYLADVEGDDGQRVLLRVIGPPYYTLLRALDQSTQGNVDDEKRVRAYVERAPRVWVEIGYNHPMAEQIRPPEGQMLMLRPPRRWTYLTEGGFHDVYEVLDFKLPAGSVEWQEIELPKKLTVPMRLTAGNAADVPELWVLRHNGVDQLDALVRDADERLMQRLAFAVAEGGEGEEPTIVLRVRPSKQAPPVLPLENVLSFKPFWKLPNLFLPVGTRLQPTLRRDAVRKLLADDPATVVWLMPLGEGKFAPETLPDEAFRPLEDWIDYVIDHQRAALMNWVQATHFDFESFVCKDDQATTPKGPGGGKGKRRPGEGDEGPEVEEPIELPQTRGRKKGQARTDEADYGAPAVQAPPSELKKKLDELEKQFLELEGSLDSPERQALWPQLAQLNAALDKVPDAAVCWMNVIWETEDVPGEWLWSWLKAENKDAKRELTKAELDRMLAQPSPTPSEVRSFVANVIWAARQENVPQVLVNRLADVQRFLEANEDLLGVRAAWLGWVHLAHLSGKDVLGLARARDRLLQRLLDKGLNSERDLPTFLRFAGLRDSERMRVVRDRALKLHQLVRKWVTLDDKDITEDNHAYIDLMFAFGLARLGEVTACRELLNSARDTLGLKRDPKHPSKRDPGGKTDDVHTFLGQAFEFRVEQALAGRPHAGPLSQDLLEQLELLDKMPRYVVDRMREQSRILEPQEKFDPYRMWKKQTDELLRELAELPDVKESGKLAERIKKLVREGVKGKHTPETRVYVLSETLPLAPRIGEEFTLELLQQVPGALESVSASSDPQTIERQALLLERALFQAAHFDRVEQVQALTAKFVQILQGKSGKPLHDAINLLAGQCLRSLRKLGLRDEIHRLLHQMTDLVVQNQSLAQLRAKHSKDWPETVRTLLHLAAGWLYFGWVDRAVPILDEARLVLFDEAAAKDKTNQQEYTKLARTYATVLGQGPVDMALTRIEEMFRKMAKLQNTFTTATHYSRLHLNVVEDVVLAIVSDDFALGPTARRWLDDDEYLVRRRIHRDMRQSLAHGGL